MGFGVKRQVNVVRRGGEELSDLESILSFNSFGEFVAGRKGDDKDSCNSSGPAYVFGDGKRKLAGATARATNEAMNSCGDGGGEF